MPQRCFWLGPESWSTKHRSPMCRASPDAFIRTYPGSHIKETCSPSLSTRDYINWDILQIANTTCGCIHKKTGRKQNCEIHLYHTNLYPGGVHLALRPWTQAEKKNWTESLISQILTKKKKKKKARKALDAVRYQKIPLALMFMITFENITFLEKTQCYI